MRKLRTMHLFAGAGGGLLADVLLGHQPVCAVEIDEYCQQVLSARQEDGCFPWFPIFEDVQAFDGRPWRGLVDVVSGGFPCQDISAAGSGAGIDGDRSGLWREMARIIGEVRPRFVLVENSPLLVGRGLAVVLGDLAKMGFDAEWACVSASDLGAPHQRDRIWLVAYSNGAWELQQAGREQDQRNRIGNGSEAVAHAASERQPRQGEPFNSVSTSQGRRRKAGDAFNVRQFEKWPIEPGLDRVADGIANRMDRLKAIGNGQVPLCAATAWRLLANI